MLTWSPWRRGGAGVGSARRRRPGGACDGSGRRRRRGGRRNGAEAPGTGSGQATDDSESERRTGRGSLRFTCLLPSPPPASLRNASTIPEDGSETATRAPSAGASSLQLSSTRWHLALADWSRLRTFGSAWLAAPVAAGVKSTRGTAEP